MGGNRYRGFPYYNQQGIGAWLTLGILILWVSRPHLKTVFTMALKSTTPTNEPFQYRTALLGILIGTYGSRLYFSAGGYVCRDSPRLSMPLLPDVHSDNVCKGSGRCAISRSHLDAPAIDARLGFRGSDGSVRRI